MRTDYTTTLLLRVSLPHFLDIRAFITVIKLYFRVFCVSSGRCPEVPAKRPTWCWKSIWCQTPQVCTVKKKILIISKTQIPNSDNFICPQGGNSVQFPSLQADPIHKTMTTMTRGSISCTPVCYHLCTNCTCASLMSINPDFACYMITKTPCQSAKHTFFTQTRTQTHTNTPLYFYLCKDLHGCNLLPCPKTYPFQLIRTLTLT